MWTHFWDMHSGGGLKEPPYESIYIEAPEKEAIKIFTARFGHDPTDVACGCCGENYSMSEGKSLRELSAYHRSCACAAFYKDDETEVTETNYDRDLQWAYEKNLYTYKGREVEYRYIERPDMSAMEYGASEQACIERYRTLIQYISAPQVLVIPKEV